MSQAQQNQAQPNQAQLPLRQTLEQERAKKAWEQVKGLMEEVERKIKEANKKEEKDEEEKKKEGYISVVRSAPALILSCGLGQTLAFYCSKGGAQKILANHLAEWLLRDGQTQNKNAESLLDEIMKSDSSRYRQLTSEAMAYLIWLKRFADALEKSKNAEEHGKEAAQA